MTQHMSEKEAIGWLQNSLQIIQNTAILIHELQDLKLQIKKLERIKDTWNEQISSIKTSKNKVIQDILKTKNKLFWGGHNERELSLPAQMIPTKDILDTLLPNLIIYLKLKYHIEQLKKDKLKSTLDSIFLKLQEIPLNINLLDSARIDENQKQEIQQLIETPIPEDDINSAIQKGITSSYDFLFRFVEALIAMFIYWSRLDTQNNSDEKKDGITAHTNVGTIIAPPPDTAEKPQDNSIDHSV